MSSFGFFRRVTRIRPPAAIVIDSPDVTSTPVSDQIELPVISSASGGTASFVATNCVFDDCGVVIELLRARYGLTRIAYVDIDAHHGDGVFYAFESDPAVIFADLHEDGAHLYPGTGSADETGKGEAAGTKLNIPMPPGADGA